MFARKTEEFNQDRQFYFVKEGFFSFVSVVLVVVSNVYVCVLFI